MYPKLFTSVIVSVIIFHQAENRNQIGYDPIVTVVSDTSMPDILRSTVIDEKSNTLKVTFLLNGPGEVQLKLSEMSGKNVIYDQTLKIETAGEHVQSIDLQKVKKGNYVLEFRSRNKFSAKKLIVKN